MVHPTPGGPEHSEEQTPVSPASEVLEEVEDTSEDTDGWGDSEDCGGAEGGKGRDRAPDISMPVFF